jgi:leader peptidase (prepilin peptidase) / N-methyltransferase
VPTWFWLTTLFVFGLAFGSFGNVVIWRLPRRESLSHPPSHCPVCETPIAWYDNIPVVSWLALRGRCRACGTPISSRYIGVEIASGILWLLAGVLYGVTVQSLFAAAFFYILLLLAFIDAEVMRLPNPLLIVLASIGAVGIALSQWAHVPCVPLMPLPPGLLGQPVVAAALGAIASAGTAALIAAGYAAVRGEQGFGAGDVKLLAVLGIYLGLYGLLTLFLGNVMAAVYGITTARMRGESLQYRFPFGPFLVAAAVLTVVYGPALWGWYLGLLGQPL